MTIGRARYLQAIGPIRPMMLDDQVKLNDPGASQYLIETLARDGWNGLLRFYEAEVWRLRNRAGDDAPRGAKLCGRGRLSRCAGGRLALARHFVAQAGPDGRGTCGLRRAIWR